MSAPKPSEANIERIRAWADAVSRGDEDAASRMRYAASRRREGDMDYSIARVLLWALDRVSEVERSWYASNRAIAELEAELAQAKVDAVQLMWMADTLVRPPEVGSKLRSRVASYAVTGTVMGADDTERAKGAGGGNG